MNLALTKITLLPPILVYCQVITSAIPENVGERLIGLITSREEIPELLKVHLQVYCIILGWQIIL